MLTSLIHSPVLIVIFYQQLSSATKSVAKTKPLLNAGWQHRTWKHLLEERLDGRTYEPKSSWKERRTSSISQLGGYIWGGEKSAKRQMTMGKMKELRWTVRERGSDHDITRNGAYQLSKEWLSHLKMKGKFSNLGVHAGNPVLPVASHAHRYD